MAVAAQPLRAQRTTPAFGLKMGASLESLRAGGVQLDTTGNRFQFSAPSVPAPDSGFSQYYLTITPGSGLCEVMAISARESINDASGATVRSLFAAERAALEAQYGAGHLVDRVFGDFGYDSIDPAADTSRNWMASVHGGDHDFFETWPADSDRRLTPDIRSMKLEVVAQTDASGFLTLKYDAPDTAHCQVDADDKSDSGA
jgi:hypothetical protein